MKRREFVAAAAASATGILRAADGPVGAVFLGTTHSHASAKLKLIRNSPEYKLLAVWDEDATARQKAAADGLKVAPSREELLREPGLEVVFVESDIPDHARHAKLALQAGMHVHVEKPPATNVAEFRALQELAAKKKRLMQQGYMWRYHAAFREMRESVKRGAIGDVHLVTGVIHKSALDEAERRAWGRFPGGHMFELGSHLIDQMVLLMGRPKRVTPFLSRRGSDTFADNTVAVMEFVNGALGLIVGASVSPDGNRYRSFEIAGNKGILTLAPIEPGELYLDVNRKRERIPTPKYSRYEDDFKALASAIRSGTPLWVTPEQDLMVQEVLIEASGMRS